jgi:hypothetical protein
MLIEHLHFANVQFYVCIYIFLFNRAVASPDGWVHLEGSLMLDHVPAQAAAYIEGPPAGIDLLIKRFSIFSIIKHPAIRPILKVRVPILFDMCVYFSYAHIVVLLLFLFEI